jgi:hypothetical protein
MNVRLVMVGLLGMVNWVHQWYRPEGGLESKEIADEFLKSMLYGILTDEGKAAQTNGSR